MNTVITSTSTVWSQIDVASTGTADISAIYHPVQQVRGKKTGITHGSRFMSKALRYSAVKVDQSWSGAQSLDDRKNIKKAVNISRQRLSAYADKINGDIHNLTQCLKEITNFARDNPKDPLSKELLDKAEWALMDTQP